MWSFKMTPGYCLPLNKIGQLHVFLLQPVWVELNTTPGGDNLCKWCLLIANVICSSLLLSYPKILP